jgi:hypothetical protein
MSDVDQAEQALFDDLAKLGERLRDEKFSTELYRALAGGHLSKDGRAVAPSWTRAEEIVNQLRTELGYGEPLTLAQTGGEGELSDDAAEAFRQLDWEWRPRDPSEHDPAHRASDPSPPPPDAGERHAPVSDPHAWEREAHEEAEASRLGRPDAPAESLPGTGAGGGEPPRVGGS